MAKQRISTYRSKKNGAAQHGRKWKRCGGAKAPPRGPRGAPPRAPPTWAGLILVFRPTNSWNDIQQTASLDHLH